MSSRADWHARVLVVEDHPDLAATVCDYLTGAGFDVDYAADGFSALQLASEFQFDVIILDIMLPKLDGFQVCERLRRDLRSDVPILMLTARDQLEDKLRGLEGGADDYLVKPFDMSELVARLKAIVRRTRGEFEAQILTVHDLSLDLENRQAQRDGKVLRLSPTLFKILKILMRESPSLVRRESLERELWGDLLPDSDTLRSHVYQLRKIIDKPFAHNLLETQAGTGYRLIPPAV